MIGKDSTTNFKGEHKDNCITIPFRNEDNHLLLLQKEVYGGTEKLLSLGEPINTCNTVI